MQQRHFPVLGLEVCPEGLDATGDQDDLVDLEFLGDQVDLMLGQSLNGASGRPPPYRNFSWHNESTLQLSML